MHICSYLKLWEVIVSKIRRKHKRKEVKICRQKKKAERIERLNLKEMNEG